MGRSQLNPKSQTSRDIASKCRLIAFSALTFRANCKRKNRDRNPFRVIWAVGTFIEKVLFSLFSLICILYTRMISTCIYTGHGMVARNITFGYFINDFYCFRRTFSRLSRTLFIDYITNLILQPNASFPLCNFCKILSSKLHAVKSNFMPLKIFREMVGAYKNFNAISLSTGSDQVCMNKCSVHYVVATYVAL